MVEIKDLIGAVQILTIVAATFRFVIIKMQHLHDEDQKPVNQKLKNIIKIVIMIETVITIVAYLQGYYGFAM